VIASSLKVDGDQVDAQFVVSEQLIFHLNNNDKD
jgi:hypothetical protein